jgi:hypothetical protein
MAARKAKTAKATADSNVATVDPPADLASDPSAADTVREEAAPAAEPIAGAHVGVPVQFQMPSGPLPAILQRQAAVDPRMWDLKVFLPAAVMASCRNGVRFSEEPQVGYWNFLPGWPRA